MRMDRKESALYVLFQPKSNNCAAVVSYMAGYFKNNGAYYTSIKDLSIGDVVFFQNSKGLSHVGLCVDWSDTKKTFTTIEGNHNDKVDYGVYNFSDVGGYVAGFGKPRYIDELTRKAALEYAKSQIGYTEGPNNWNKYADQLDKVDYFAGCGKKQNLPWCAVFVCAVMYNAYNAQVEPEPEPTPVSDTVDINLRVLKLGDYGGDVYTIQMLLNEIGFRDQNGKRLAYDWSFGSKTQYALMQYQKARELPVTGVCDFATWNRILK